MWQAITILSSCLAIIWLFGWAGSKWLSDTEYDFYGPTIDEKEEEKPDYYAHDERGRAFLRTWYEGWEKLL